jgi:hypothetical protein
MPAAAPFITRCGHDVKRWVLSVTDCGILKFDVFPSSAGIAHESRSHDRLLKLALEITTMTRSTKRKLVGSILTATVGWATSFTYELGRTLYYFGFLRHELVFSAQVAGIVFAVTWFFLLLPIYFLVPFQFWLWRWPVGTLFGMVLCTTLHWIIFQDSFANLVRNLIPCGIAGGAIGLFGSLTARYFVRPQPNDGHDV